MDEKTPETPPAAEAAAPEATATPAAEAPAKKSKKGFFILIALCIVGTVALRLSFVFFFIGMLPALAAYFIDRDKHKYIFFTVAALNFAGVFPYMMEIVMQGSTFIAIEAKLTDPIVWFVMYAVASLGWLIVWLSPILATMALQGMYRGRIAHMETAQKKLIEEWGTEVNGELGTRI